MTNVNGMEKKKVSISIYTDRSFPYYAEEGAFQKICLILVFCTAGCLIHPCPHPIPLPLGSLKKLKSLNSPAPRTFSHSLCLPDSKSSISAKLNKALNLHCMVAKSDGTSPFL